MMMRAFRTGCVGLGLALLAAGCTQDAVNRDRQNSFLTAGDMTTMTDAMASSLASAPEVAQIISQKPMKIVLKPIQNETNEIIRPGEKEMYVSRVRALLAREPALRKQFVFVLNRADYEHLRQSEGLTEEQLGQHEERVQPEYALWGTFYVNTNVSTRTRSDTYLCKFKLTDLATGVTIWEGTYETSKRVQKEFLD